MRLVEGIVAEHWTHKERQYIGYMHCRQYSNSMSSMKSRSARMKSLTDSKVYLIMSFDQCQVVVVKIDINAYRHEVKFRWFLDGLSELILNLRRQWLWPPQNRKAASLTKLLPNLSTRKVSCLCKIIWDGESGLTYGHRYKSDKSNAEENTLGRTYSELFIISTQPKEEKSTEEPSPGDISM